MRYDRRAKRETFKHARKMRRRPTPAELALWKLLEPRPMGRLIRFRRQVVILGWIADFFCSRGQVVIEVDGPIHESQRRADAFRDRTMREYGFTVLRVTNDEVLTEPDAVIRRISTVIHRLDVNKILSQAVRNVRHPPRRTPRNLT